MNGGHSPILVEPTVAVKTYAAQWFRPEIDLNELAKLRWDKGWSLRRIAAHLEVPKTTIIKRLNHLKEDRSGKSTC